MTATFRRSANDRFNVTKAGRMLAGAGVLLMATTIFGVTQCARAQPPATATTRSTEVGAAVMPLDSVAMRNELLRLDGICARLGLAKEQALMQQWCREPSDDSQPLYLPLPRDPIVEEGKPGVAAEAKHASWLKHFSTARQRHAEYWFQQAQEHVAAGDEWTAYKTLWRAAREDASHGPVKQALGPLLIALNVKGRPKNVNVPHAELKWPAGTYTRIETSNFRLTSRADANTTLAIAGRLESFYGLWTQIFYPLWAAPNVTSSRIAGRNTNWGRRNQFDVILCKDRNDYLKTLGVSEANIGVSVGYYNPEAKMSFFYPDAELDATLYHELTHQLLSEGSQLKSRGEPGAERDFWMVEGVALHTESLKRQGLDWKLGGWLAPRMQTARYRSLHDGYWIDWQQLSESGMEQWKSNPEIAKLYSHASGLSHYFLDQRLPEHSSEQNAEKVAPLDTNASHAAYYFALVAVYQGNLGPTEKLHDLIGREKAQRNYVNYLLVRDRHLDSLRHAAEPELRSVRDLVLTRSQLTADSWRTVAGLTGLEWLDCSFSNATSQDLAWLDRLASLKRLSLEGTAIDASTLAKVARLSKLTELDLSHCPSIDDQALSALARHATLETLWLSGTQISQASVKLLESLPRLSFVDVTSTRIEKSEADALTKRIAGRKP